MAPRIPLWWQEAPVNWETIPLVIHQALGMLTWPAFWAAWLPLLQQRFRLGRPDRPVPALPQESNPGFRPFDSDKTGWKRCSTYHTAQEGRSRQGAPVRKIHKIPFMMGRCSLVGCPVCGFCWGKRGWSRSHCSFDKSPRFMAPIIQDLLSLQTYPSIEEPVLYEETQISHPCVKYCVKAQIG